MLARPSQTGSSYRRRCTLSGEQHQQQQQEQAQRERAPLVGSTLQRAADRPVPGAGEHQRPEDCRLCVRCDGRVDHCGILCQASTRSILAEGGALRDPLAAGGALHPRHRRGVELCVSSRSQKPWRPQWRRRCSASAAAGRWV